MHDLTYLREILVLLAVSIFVVAVLSRFKIPSITAYILAGFIIGPDSLGLIGNSKNVILIADIGVALLLFGIGLELSVDKLTRFWKTIFFGGLIQVGLCIALTVGILMLVGYTFEKSVFFGFLVALSSTAIVLRGLEERGELETLHGRFSLSLLIFQDISVVPMMLLLPLLLGNNGAAGDVLNALFRSVLIIIGILVLSYFVIPRVLHLIARTRQRHLFIISILLICIGVAYVMSSSGVSLALGAFFAGLIVGGSQYRHQALAEILPFKEVFTSIFFISVGMLISPASILNNVATIIIILAAIFIGKALIIFLTARITGLPLRTAIYNGLVLAQIGEFSFVLVLAAKSFQPLDDPLITSMLAAATITMFVTPFSFSIGSWLVEGLGKLSIIYRKIGVDKGAEIEKKISGLSDHVIIGGYGFAGRQLSKALKKCNIPFLIVDLSIDNLRDAAEEGADVLFGDITNTHVLERSGIERARGLVVAVNDINSTEEAVRKARQLSSDVRIFVRTQYLLDVNPLLNDGASEVIPAEREAAVELIRKVLQTCCVDDPKLIELVQTVRKSSEDY